MSVLSTVRYEFFHDSSDITHKNDWVCLTTMMHDGTNFIIYETSYFHREKMTAVKWDGLLERIKTAAANPLCEVSHSKVLRDTNECTTYTINVYGEG